MSMRSEGAGRRAGVTAGAALGVWAAALGVAWAHNTWILPHGSALDPGATVTLDLTSGMKFPAPEAAIAPDRILKAACRLAGSTVDLPARSPEEKLLRIAGALEKAGVATIWVTLKPRGIELEAEDVRHYLDEIGAGEAIRREWMKDGLPGRWKELYTKHAKSFALVGDEAGDRTWADPVGLPLELVPESDPLAATAGVEMVLRLLKAGKPLADFAVSVARTGGTLPPHRTDTSGRVVVEIDRPGVYMASATEVRRSSNPEADWESDFTTLTWRVTPKRAAAKAKASR